MKPKFRISTLRWLTLAVACFFAGMSWNGFYERMRSSVPKKNVVAANNVVVQVGKSITITAPSNLPIPRALLNDPTLATMTAISPTSIQLKGRAAGTTTAQIWDANGVQTNYSVVVKPKAMNLLSFVGIGR